MSNTKAVAYAEANHGPLAMSGLNAFSTEQRAAPADVLSRWPLSDIEKPDSPPKEA